MTISQPAILARLDRAAAVIAGLRTQATRIERLAGEVRACFDRGGHLYTCGNGGSAAEALHLSEELIGRYKRDRRPYPAVCLAADPSALTCIANDYGYEQVFARQIEALGKPGDALVVLSTSGNSPNIERALISARARQVRTLGLLGKGGGRCAPLCDVALVVDATETEHVQEAHQVLIHLILEAVEG
ncbi:MAG: SIS domain-containing protein [Phycisphaerae bacterium]|nr:SIS domain-containing protein [Phycisphaerae bacterium]